MRVKEYLRSLINSSSQDSSKNFSLVVSVLVGAALGATVCFVMIYDVLLNGYLKTDLNDLGVFLLCISGYIAGGGINKAITENLSKKKSPPPTNNTESAKEG